MRKNKVLLDEKKKLKFTMLNDDIKERRKLTKKNVTSKHLHLPLPYPI